jgi:hypothetical protein
MAAISAHCCPREETPPCARGRLGPPAAPGPEVEGVVGGPARPARAAAGGALDPASVHFHDLRHTGHHLAAATGATTKELMARMGHSTMRAALTYQHATQERDRKIADGLSEQIKASRRAPVTEAAPEGNGHATGTSGVGRA